MTTDTNYALKRTDEPALKFSGVVIGHASNSPDSAATDYSGEVGRYQEITLYETATGKYVVSVIHRTNWDGERDHYAAKVCNTEEELYAHLGHDDLAQELYAAAGLEPAELIG